MLAVNAKRAAPASTERDPQVSDRAGGAIENLHNTAGHGAATDAPQHDRAWWLVEARPVGRDWPAIIALHLATIVPLTTKRFSLACDICGAHPCINPTFCEQCRNADAWLRTKKRNSPESIPQDWDRMSIDRLWHVLNCERQRAARQQINERIERLKIRGVAL